jgi:hypothetical protein
VSAIFVGTAEDVVGKDESYLRWTVSAQIRSSPAIRHSRHGQSGNLDPESKTWIIDTARRFYQHRARDFPEMAPIGELRVQSIARNAGCAQRI